MELAGSIPCKATKQKLWEALFNPEIWKESIPEAQRYALVGDNLYEMEVKAEMGPVKGNQLVKIHFTDLNPPTSCNFELQHQLVKSATGSFKIEEAANSTSTLNYSLKADAGNPLFNAVLENFKEKVKNGLEEVFGRIAEKA